MLPIVAALVTKLLAERVEIKYYQHNISQADSNLTHFPRAQQSLRESAL